MLATAEHYFWLIDSLRLKKKGGGEEKRERGRGREEERCLPFVLFDPVSVNDPIRAAGI